MWKDWIWPVLSRVLKFVCTALILVGVWTASGYWHRKSFKDDAEILLSTRVRSSCLRPEWVQTPEQASQYDVEAHELELVIGQVELLRQRTTSLLENAERVEGLRKEIWQDNLPSPGGIGGPAPTRRR